MWMVENHLKKETFLKQIFGEMFDGKVLISEKLNKILFVDGIRFITNIRKNMKNGLIVKNSW